ncbi:MAG TPA: hypothetical protein VEZ42_08370, partial [Pseudonocardia sp.]|nr:hypothetical protein [Pseudonocardia sp.]
DRQRDLALDDLDWQTMRFTVDDVLRTPGDTVRRVRHRLAERHARFAAQPVLNPSRTKLS